LRAFEIGLILIIINATIVCFGQLGVFPNDVLGTPPTTGLDYTTWTVTETLSPYNRTAIENNSILAIGVDIVASASWLVYALPMVGKIIFATVTLYPLFDFFMIPKPLSYVLGVGIVAMTIWGFASWLSGRSTRFME